MSVGKAPALLGALLLALCGCASETEHSRPVAVNPFVEHVDNPWFPLVPGTTYVYRGMKDGEPAREVLRVTNARKAIQGVQCTVVADTGSS